MNLNAGIRSVFFYNPGRIETWAVVLIVNQERGLEWC